MKRAITVSFGLLASFVACGGDAPPPSTPVQAAPVTPPPTTAAADTTPTTLPPAPVTVPRGDWNRIANELDLPLYWIEDKDKDSVLDSDELALVWGVDPNAKLGDYIASGTFTPKFAAVQDAVLARFKNGLDKNGLTQDEITRRTAVMKELAQGRPTLVQTDMTSAPDEDKKFVRHVLSIATIIERLYGKQEGTLPFAAKIPADDTASKMLFFRAQGPKCGAPLTQGDPACAAVPGGAKNVPGKLSGLYPSEVPLHKQFCEELTKSADKKLMDPFTVVRVDTSPGPKANNAKSSAQSKDGDTSTLPNAPLPAMKAVPYTVEYKDDMELVAKELEAAAADVTSANEAPLKAYLLADAKAFRDNNWWPADEAWAKMSVANSKWYVRIAPDETYSEPCSTKALFHVSFGKINQASVKWQQKLDPKKNDMEKAIADLAGPPYKARKVSFKLPDFMDVVLNAGDSRTEFGATIGQSLPNFGPVANGGRGRTVAMTNFYSDPDSLAAQDSISASMLCSETMAKYSRDPEPLLVSTVLHEATHNLGPSHQYKVNGKIDREAFGGGLASMLEELKAQSGALFFIDWLANNNEYSKDDAQKSHVRDLLWSFGHISRGMYDDDGHPKAYSQLAAIQLGVFMREGAVKWEDRAAANGTDKGCFNIDFDKLPAAVKTMMTEVAQVKGTGDKARGEKLVAEFVNVPKDDKVRTTITERVLRQPKPSFYYSVKMD